MKEILARPITKVPALRGRNVTIIFYEASTRTRVSFEVAAKNLSADVVNIAASASSVTKGESLVDTIRTIEALGADMIVMRHGTSGAPYLAAEVFSGSVLNGGDGWHAHPTQALLDLYTMRAHLGDLRGRKVVILGDVLHSRVARSNVWTLTAMGADLWICGPTPILRGFDTWAGALGERARAGADTPASPSRPTWTPPCATPTSSWPCGSSASGWTPGCCRSLREYAARFGLTRERLAAAKPDALVMHPGPMNEGVEIAPDVAVLDRSVITEQVTNGVAVRMALLYLLAGVHGGTRRARSVAETQGSGGRARARGAGGMRVGETVELLEISRAWLVDPVAGREGPGEIVVRDGDPGGRDLARGRRGGGIGPDGVVVAPGFLDLHVHLREPGNEDAETVASGLAAAAHGGFTTVCAMPNTTPAADEPGVFARVRAAAAASGSPVELLLHGAVTVGRAGERLAALGELADAGAVGFSDDGSPVKSAVLLRNALLYVGMLGVPLFEHAEDSTLTAGAEANEGYVATILGLKGWPVAGEVAAVERAIAVLTAVLPDATRARLHLTHLSTAGGARRGPAGEGRRAARDLRRDAAPPRLHRRMAGRSAPLGLGGGGRRWRRARPVGRRRPRRAPVRHVLQGQPAAPGARGRRRRAWPPSSTAPPTRSPPTTPRTRRSTRRPSSAWRPTGSAASRRRSGCCWPRSVRGD